MSAAPFTDADLDLIETFSGAIVLGLASFDDVALCRVGQDHIGVPPGHPRRAALLEALKARALALGYDGAPFPDRDPDDALFRLHLLAQAMDVVPRDAGWAAKLVWMEGQLAGLDLDAPDLAAQVAALQAAYTPSSPAAPPIDPNLFGLPYASVAAAVGCVGGKHAWGPPDGRGWRTCAACGTVNTITDENPGAYAPIPEL